MGTWPSLQGGSQVRPGFAQCVEGLMLGLLFAGSVCLRHVSTGVARVCATAACRLTRVTSGDSSDVDLYHSASGTWSTARLSVSRSMLAATSVGNVALFAGGWGIGGYSNVVDLYLYNITSGTATSAPTAATTTTVPTTSAAAATLYPYNITSGTATSAPTAATTTTVPTTSAAAATVPLLEHPKIVLTLTGSIGTFGEGSTRRTVFVSGLAAVLRILEEQIIIVSVTEGSIIIEMGFVRLGGAHPSPADVVSRLKSAAVSRELDQFGLIGLSVGEENIVIEATASVDVGIIVGVSVGGVICFILLMAAIRYSRKHQSQVNLCFRFVELFCSL